MLEFRQEPFIYYGFIRYMITDNFSDEGHAKVRYRLIITIFPLICVGCLSCKKKADDEELQVGRKDAFSSKDIQSVFILFEKKSVEPWTVNKPYLVGVFANKSQGNIRDGVSWSVSDTDLVHFSNKTGVFSAVDEGELTLTAKYMDVTVTKDITVSYIDGSLLRDLIDPGDVAATQVVGEGKVDLSWTVAEYHVEGVKVSYLEGGAEPAKKCAGGDGEVAISFDDLVEKTSYQLTGLTLGKTYQIRICSVQRIFVEQEEMRRSSEGKVITITL